MKLGKKHEALKLFEDGLKESDDLQVGHHNKSIMYGLVLFAPMVSFQDWTSISLAKSPNLLFRV